MKFAAVIPTDVFSGSSEQAGLEDFCIWPAIYAAVHVEAGKSGVLLFFPGNKVDRMAFIARLGPRMGLVAMVARLHRGPVGPRVERVVFDVAVAVDAQGFLVGVKLVGYIHDPHILRVRLLAVRDRRVAPQAVLVHQLVAGGKLSRDELAGARVAIRAGHGSGMDAGGKPKLRGFLILMTAQTEKRMGGRKPHQPKPRDGREHQEDRHDKRPGLLRQIGNRWNFHVQPPQPPGFLSNLCFDDLVKSLFERHRRSRSNILK
jgi:hypothetical protein